MNFQFAFLTILFFYLVATAFYLLRLITARPLLSVIGLRITVVTALLQFATLATHFFTIDRPVFTDYLDYFQTSALILAVIFIVLCFTKRFYVAGSLFLCLIDVFCTLSLTYANPYVPVLATRGQGYMVFHLSAIFLSLSVFAMGFISAILFLISESQIKHKRLDGWVSKLPPLASLDEVHYKALYVGFVLFTFAILTGAGYSKVQTGHYISESFKQILSFILWIFFAVLLNFRVRQGWQGHKGVILSLVGFAGMILLFLVGLS